MNEWEEWLEIVRIDAKNNPFLKALKKFRAGAEIKKETSGMMTDENNIGCKNKGNQMVEKRYVIVRTYAMGVFAGTLDPESTETKKILTDARRIWYWDGAASLSQLATDGTSKPKNCKFPVEVSRVELTSPQGFEILDVTPKARESIASVVAWKK